MVVITSMATIDQTTLVNCSTLVIGAVDGKRWIGRTEGRVAEAHLLSIIGGVDARSTLHEGFNRHTFRLDA
jgi:uncharacterized membrane protein